MPAALLVGIATCARLDTYQICDYREYIIVGKLLCASLDEDDPANAQVEKSHRIQGQHSSFRRHEILQEAY